MRSFERAGVSIKRVTRGALPRAPFIRLRDAVLGKKYKLSVVFAGSARLRKLNHLYRKKNKPTDILAFSISPREGELIISLTEVGKKARQFGRTYRSYFTYLIIHGLLHLKGLSHGSKMTSKERALERRFLP